VVVVTDPESSDVQEALGPVLTDLAVEKIGADVKALRVALARRGLRLAGPAFDLSLASYCLNPSQPSHDIAALAEEILGQPRETDTGPAPAARAAHAALALPADLDTRLPAPATPPLYRD